MTQYFLTPAAFDEVARTAVAQAEQLVQRLDALSSTGDRLRAEAQAALGGHVRRLDSVNGAPRSGLDECFAVTLPTRSGQGVGRVTALIRHAEWERRSAEVRRHGST